MNQLKALTAAAPRIAGEEDRSTVFNLAVQGQFFDGKFAALRRLRGRTEWRGAYIRALRAIRKQASAPAGDWERREKREAAAVVAAHDAMYPEVS